MNVKETTAGIRTIEARINYLASGSFINRRFVAPGEEVSTGNYEPYTVMMRDGSSIKDSFNLDTHGMVLTEHKSAITDFFNKEQVDALYPDEVMESVKHLTGATCVAPLGWMVRTSGDLKKYQQQAVGYTHQGGVQPPASDVHVDVTPACAASRAKDVYDRNFPDGRPYHRFIISSLWRTFSPSPPDWPLAVCEGNSVGGDEGTANTMIVVDKLPSREEMLGDIPDEDTAIAADVFRYNPGHKWWYFPDMNRDEVLMFKLFDSDQTKAWRVPHTAFLDTSFPDVKIRQSIEARTIAYFI